MTQQYGWCEVGALNSDWGKRIAAAKDPNFLWLADSDCGDFWWSIETHRDGFGLNSLLAHANCPHVQQETYTSFDI